MIPWQSFEVGEFFDGNGFDEKLGGLQID